MRVNEFTARINRALNKEVIEDLYAPWSEELFLPPIRKVIFIYIYIYLLQLILEGLDQIKL